MREDIKHLPLLKENHPKKESLKRKERIKHIPSFGRKPQEEKGGRALLPPEGHPEKRTPNR
ncbi:UNVERIFIED_CONTAM: hypothetical protein Sradi_5852800 [Sesamum radiatum]|uniref:Uncharacterized protein n=1 Tax=Sesamum radiatum TaxID=300843 RepID=A0AAW2KPV9_SESRA